MTLRWLVHLSDLHVGLSPAHDRATAAMADGLRDSDVHHVLVTGDVTHRGRDGEMAAFWRAFAPLRADGRLSVVPGNHDRLGDDAGAALMQGRRVAVVERTGLHLVLVDSTAPHNRSLWSAHGRLDGGVLAAVDDALRAAPAGALVAVALHHHPLALPGENVFERLSDLLGMPHGAELALGRELVELCRGRCDLVLHGHRHRPRLLVIDDGEPRPLAVHNAGSSPELGRIALFARAAGRVFGPRWLDTAVPAAAQGRRRRAPTPPAMPMTTPAATSSG